MKIQLTGENGGIGSAIKEALKDHEFSTIPDSVDWLICAHGFIGETDIQKTFDTNTVLCLELTRSALPTLRKGIIYISSTAGIKGNTKFPVYSASKAALNLFTQTMAKKFTDFEFYAICPGPTKTKMWDSLGLDGVAQAPEEVTKAVLKAMSGEFPSGSLITVRDGVISL